MTPSSSGSLFASRTTTTTSGTTRNDEHLLACHWGSTDAAAAAADDDAEIIINSGNSRSSRLCGSPAETADDRPTTKLTRQQQHKSHISRPSSTISSSRRATCSRMHPSSKQTSWPPLLRRHLLLPVLLLSLLQLASFTTCTQVSLMATITIALDRILLLLLLLLIAAINARSRLANTVEHSEPRGEQQKNGTFFLFLVSSLFSVVSSKLFASVVLFALHVSRATHNALPLPSPSMIAAAAAAAASDDNGELILLFPSLLLLFEFPGNCLLAFLFEKAKTTHLNLSAFFGALFSLFARSLSHALLCIHFLCAFIFLSECRKSGLLGAANCHHYRRQ